MKYNWIDELPLVMRFCLVTDFTKFPEKSTDLEIMLLHSLQKYPLVKNFVF